MMTNPPQHDQGLEHIGAGDSEKPSDEGIGENGQQGDDDRYVMACAGVIQVEELLKQLGARDKPGADAAASGFRRGDRLRRGHSHQTAVVTPITRRSSV